jgi:hypothetical protein
MNYTKYEMNLSQNYWGSSDEQTIKNKIYDGYDDVEKGIVKFEPIMAEGVSLVDRKAPVWTQNSYLNAYYNQVDGKSDITLTWRSAIDDMYVKAYRIYLDGQLIKTLDSLNVNDEYYEYLYVIEDVPVGKHTIKLEAGDFEGNWSSQPLETEIEVWDQTAPVWPEESELIITESNATSATIEWTPAIDNVGVTKYRILVDDSTWVRWTDPLLLLRYPLYDLGKNTRYW